MRNNMRSARATMVYRSFAWCCFVLVCVSSVLIHTTSAFIPRSHIPSGTSTTTSCTPTKVVPTMIKQTTLYYQVMTQDEEKVTHFKSFDNAVTTTTTTPTIATSDTDDTTTPSLGEIRKLLPKSVFQVNTKTSLFYFALDLLAVMVSMGSLYMTVTSDYYHMLPIYLQAMTVVPLQLVTGFAMWCMWCIGHDAGHTTVSKHRKYGNGINRIVGEIAHSMICLTPFIPWKKSHLQHHLNHNHIDRDYSHQWFVREESHNLHPLIQLSYQTRNVQLPILYLVYLLLGVPDGGHVYFYGRLWDKESFAEKAKAYVSVFISIATAATLWTTLGTADFVVICMVPWLILSLWLFTVTYLQHHSEDGKLYTDDTWTFTKGAFQTVDRDYGSIINRLSHHMMDGHVIHHLFFTRVPHYHLKEATDALLVGMKENGTEQLYKQIETHNFGFEIVKQFNDNWFFCDEAQVVRK
jgi:acyl-lipid omega-3 desaturase